MIKTAKYKNLAERQQKAKDLEAQGFRMTSDNFDNPKWKHGSPIIGTMTFTDEPEPQVVTEPIIDLAQKRMDALEARIAQLEGGI